MRKRYTKNGLCEWFAMCDRAAAGTVDHPALGAVPTCRKCADRFGLKLTAAPCPRCTYGDACDHTCDPATAEEYEHKRNVENPGSRR